MEQKKTEYSEWNIYRKLAKARVELQRKSLKKSGINKFANFNYFQLDDFLPAINEIFNEIGLVSHFNIEPKKMTRTINESGVVTEKEEPERAILTIINIERPTETLVFASDTAEAGTKGATEIQQLGSKHTYMRRYVWIEAMEITESDGIDGLPEDKKEAVKQGRSEAIQTKQKILPATDKQIEKINQMTAGTPERLEKMLAYYKADTVEALTLQQASEAIRQFGKKEA